MRPENLVIRAVEAADAEGLTHLQNMPGFRFGTLRTPFQRLETTRKWLEALGPELTVYVDNAPAIRLYEKFGFVSEGIRRKDAFRAGEFVDSLAMARLNF